MGRMANFDGRTIRRVAESLDLSIPDHRPVKEGLARQLIRDMGLSVDEFLELAKK